MYAVSLLMGQSNEWFDFYTNILISGVRLSLHSIYGLESRVNSLVL